MAPPLLPARRAAAHPPASPTGTCRLLTDGVVLLDSFRHTDVDAAWAGEDDQFVRRSSLPGPFGRRDIARRLIDLAHQWCSVGPKRTFAVRQAGTRRLVGGCALEIRQADPDIGELSYWAYPAYRCRGYATRAAELVCQFAFDEMGVVRVDVHIEPTNGASLRVATRAGFLRQRHGGAAGRPGTVLCSRRRSGIRDRDDRATRCKADPNRAEPDLRHLRGGTPGECSSGTRGALTRGHAQAASTAPSHRRDRPASSGADLTPPLPW